MKNALSGILDPFTLDAFLRDHLGKKSLHLRGPLERFAHLGDLEGLPRRLLGGLGPNGSASARMRAAYTDDDGRGHEIPSPPLHMAQSLYQAGMTLIFNEVDEIEPALADFAREVRDELSYPSTVGVAAILSPAGDGFAPHYDASHVFVLQLEGKKKWRYGTEPAAPSTALDLTRMHLESESMQAVMRAIGWAPEPPDETRMREQILEPGDLLYLAPGTWHSASAVGHSYALTLNLNPLSAGRVLRAALTVLAIRERNWSRDLYLEGLRRDGDPSEEVRAFALGLLDELRSELADMSPEKLLQFATLVRNTSFRRLMQTASRLVL